MSHLNLEIVRRFVIENGVYSGEIKVDGILTRVFSNMLIEIIIVYNMLD